MGFPVIFFHSGKAHWLTVYIKNTNFTREPIFDERFSGVTIVLGNECPGNNCTGERMSGVTLVLWNECPG